jgi:hypothetical protein
MPEPKDAATEPPAAPEAPDMAEFAEGVRQFEETLDPGQVEKDMDRIGAVATDGLFGPIRAVPMALKSAAAMLQRAGEANGNVGPGLGEGIAEVGREEFGLPGEIVGGVLGETLEGVVEISGEMTEHVLIAAGDVIEGVGKGAGELGDGVQKLLARDIGEGMGDITTGVRSIAGGAANAFWQVATMPVEAVGEVFEAGFEVGEALVVPTVTWGGGAIADAARAVARVPGAVEDRVTSLFDHDCGNHHGKGSDGESAPAAPPEPPDPYAEWRADPISLPGDPVPPAGPFDVYGEYPGSLDPLIEQLPAKGPADGAAVDERNFSSQLPDPPDNEPDASSPDADEPDASYPDEGQPDDEEPEASYPDEGQPDDEEPDEDQPDEDQPDDDEPDQPQSGDDEPDGDEPNASYPDDDEPDDEEPDEGQPDDDEPDDDEPDNGEPDDEPPEEEADQEVDAGPAM